MKSNKAIKPLLIVSGALTAVICAVMNLYLIPVIESTTNSIRCFDMNFGYGFDEAVGFLSSISDKGRNVYLHIQLPLDFVYPIVYCTFFVLLIYVLEAKKSALTVLPAVLAVFDYAENICVAVMLGRGAISKTFVAFASTFTAVKTLLMYICFAIIIILAVMKIKKKRNR